MVATVFIGTSRVLSTVVPFGSGADSWNRYVPKGACARISRQDYAEYLHGRCRGRPQGNGPPADALPTYGELPLDFREDLYIYFYHPDHLGSSSFITNRDGDIHEELLYFPFGETWVDARWGETEQSEGDDTDLAYRFSGKELDEETGLYYFGARYYDPRVSTWVSTDPATLTLAASSATDALRTLSTFTYGRQNPLRFSDPNGADTWDSLKGFAVGAFNVVVIAADMMVNSNGHAPSQDVEFNPPPGVWSDNAIDDEDFTRGVKIGKATAAVVTIIGAIRALRSGLEGEVPAPVGGGRGGTKLKPDPAAQGAHTTFKQDPDTGNVTGHAEWKQNARKPSGFDQVKRVDTQYANPHTHYNKVTGEEIPTPHVHERSSPGGVRPARPNELPQ